MGTKLIITETIIKILTIAIIMMIIIIYDSY